MTQFALHSVYAPLRCFRLMERQVQCLVSGISEECMSAECQSEWRTANDVGVEQEYCRLVRVFR